MAVKKRRKKKKQKYLPAYIMLYAVIAIVIILIIVLIKNIGGNKSEETQTEASTPVSSTTVPAETEATRSNNVIAPKPGVSASTNAAETTAATAAVNNSGDNWALYVIGNDNPLPSDFTVDTKSVSGERELDVRCADYAIQMLNDAKEQNVGLFVTSAYRSVEKQTANMQSYISNLISQGYSQEEAKKQAEKEIALPGHSEHNAGLAMDIVSDTYWSNHSDLDESFDQLPQYDWLIDNSWKYGFILSYPKGKEDITGFIYEPWHYRFVGLEHAKKIHEVYEKTGEFLTVNEYIEKYVN